MMPNTAVVTGAGKGIGRAIAVRLAALGYDLFLLGRGAEALASAAAECTALSVQAGFFAGDLRDPKAIDAALNAARERFGHIDVLVNNAGTARGGAVQDADLEVWREVLDLNFVAATALTRGVLPEMIERRQGAIINISSISGRHTNAGSAIYAASKHALNGFTGCLFEDVREYGIKVSSIMPGFVDTALTAGLGKRTDRMIRSEDVADAVAYVLASSANCCPTEIVLRPQMAP
jgi:NADP-dependent 3-hydroxy acid dehydrogenase YdfG